MPASYQSVSTLMGNFAQTSASTLPRWLAPVLEGKFHSKSPAEVSGWSAPSMRELRKNSGQDLAAIGTHFANMLSEVKEHQNHSEDLAK